MATFYNQATLTYNGGAVSSNIVSGEIVDVLSVAKSSVDTSYTAGDTLTYTVSIINTGNAPFTGLTVTDDLGAYTVGNTTAVPLDYVDGTVALYINGIRQQDPTVTDTSPLTVTGVDVPAGGNALLIYQATVNGRAPLAAGSTLTNTATVSGPGVATPTSDEYTLPVAAAPVLSIDKSVTPAVVPENGELTYTFVIRNLGNTDATATDDLTVTDIFDPVLTVTSVTLNGTPITSPDGYTYDEASGSFATVPGVITVPAATYSTDPSTGEIIVTPGTAILTVTGRI